MLEVFAENRQFTAQITDQRRLDSSAKHPLGRKVLFASETRCSTSRNSSATTHHINKGFWCVCVCVDYTRSYRTFFPGKRMGNSIFCFVEGKWHLTRVFLPFAIFFGSTAFHIPFLDSTSTPLTAGEPLVSVGCCVVWQFVTWEFRNKKMQQKRGETFTCS